MAPSKNPELRDDGWLASRVAGRVADAGMVREIAAELGASNQSVYAALVRAGLYVRRPGRRMGRAAHPLLSDRAWLTEQVEAGRTNLTIATEVGMSKHAVAAWVKRYGLGGRRSSGRTTGARVDREWLTQQVEAGRSNASIAADIGITAHAVAGYVQRYGLTRRRPAGTRQCLIDREWLTERVEAGRTTASIAAELGVSMSAVSAWVKRYGLTGRRPTGPRPARTPGKVSSVSYRYREALTVEYLGQRYTREQATVPQIAREVGCSGRAVYDALARHRIPLRGQARGPRPDWTAVLTADFLAVEYVGAGRDMDDIAGEIGCSAMTVQRALVRHGIPARPARPLDGRVYRDLATVDAISDLDAAEIVGAAQTTASRARRKAGIPPRRGRLPRPVDVGRMIELRAAGLSLWAISVEVGVPVSTVQRRLARVAREREDPPATG